jgi:Tfp pilus assembly protein PilZ/DNA-binding NarL/FixJ family response regulator
VVLIDRDPQLIARISGELMRAGMQVEGLSSTLGLTPELLALSTPDVVLLDTGLPGLPLDVVPAIFSDLRRRRRLRCMVIVEGDEAQVAEVTARLKADAGVPRSALEKSGALALKENSTPPAQLPPEVDPLSEVPNIGPEKKAPKKARSAPSIDILSLIEDEISKQPAPVPPSSAIVDVNIDLFSDHTVWLGRGNSLDAGGVFIATQIPPAVGTEVTLNLSVFRKPKGLFKAKVVWAVAPQGRSPGGCGVSLETALSDDLRKAFNRLIEERRPLTWTQRTP